VDRWAQSAGLSFSKLWLPVPPDTRRISVRTESGDPDSLLAWCRELIRLKKTDSAMRSGLGFFAPTETASLYVS